LKLGHWLGLIVFLIALYILWQIRHVLLLGFTAIVLATALNRGVRRVQRLRLNREIAVLLAIAATLTGIAFLVWLVALPFGKEFQLLAERTPEGLERLRTGSVWFRDVIPKPLAEQSRNFLGLSQHLQSVFNSSFGHIFRFFSDSLVLLLDGLLVLFLTIMLVVNPPPYRRAFVMLFPAFYRRRADQILSQCEIALGNWFIGMIFIVVVVAIATGIGLWALQVPLVFANAVLAGLLSFIPNIGPAVSVVPPIAVALLSAPWKGVGVLILYILLHEVTGSILIPVVMARQVSLLPAFTLLAQVAFTVLFGFLGLLLAVPLLVVLQVWLQECLVKDVLDHWHLKSATTAELVITEYAQPDAPPTDK
jgi:predicted PurR-regulated permease PerM